MGKFAENLNLGKRVLPPDSKQENKDALFLFFRCYSEPRWCHLSLTMCTHMGSEFQGKRVFFQLCPRTLNVLKI